MLYRAILWFLVIIASWLLSKMLSWMLGVMRNKFASKTASKLDDYIIDALRRKPFTHFAILLALLWVVNDAGTNFPVGDEKIIAI